MITKQVNQRQPVMYRGRAFIAAGLEIDWMIEAAADAGSRKLPTFEAVAYSGAPMRVGSLKAATVVDVESLAIPRQAVPVLREGNPSRIAGHTVSVSKSNGTVAATGLLSGDEKETADVARLAANDFPWQMNIGADPGRFDLIPENESATVNGQLMAGPLYVVRGAQLRFLSITAMGPDSGASMGVTASAVIGPDFGEWLNVRGLDFDSFDEKAMAALEAVYAGEQQGLRNTKASTEVFPTELAAEVKQMMAEGVATLKAEAAARLSEHIEQTRQDAIRRVLYPWEANRFNPLAGL